MFKKLVKFVFRKLKKKLASNQAVKYVHLYVTLFMIILMAFDRYIVIINNPFLRILKKTRKSPKTVKIVCIFHVESI